MLPVHHSLLMNLVFAMVAYSSVMLDIPTSEAAKLAVPNALSPFQLTLGKTINRLFNHKLSVTITNRKHPIETSCQQHVAMPSPRIQRCISNLAVRQAAGQAAIHPANQCV